MTTHAQRLASILLGQPVMDWVAERRSTLSYREMATELSAATNGQVNVSGEAIRRWVVDTQTTSEAAS